MVTCLGCDRRWPLSAHNVCHCTVCHETFADDTAARAHHVVDYRHHPPVTCLAPRQAKLADAGRDYPCWELRVKTSSTRRR
ncbi:FDXHR family putative zinc-binding protein [Nocardia cyriacigeorgica]|uniref:FDXHR family putative zinc-binding protein n=1 Tax=Nocardia cyriacigeorgica TaxID=135487 RepID=UPI004043D0E5